MLNIVGNMFCSVMLSRSIGIDSASHPESHDATLSQACLLAGSGVTLVLICFMIDSQKHNYF